MKFSVLMSLYNKELPFNLDACLKSILINSVKPNQIILVYDGYISDELNSVVEKFSNSLPIKIIKLETNHGLGYALNVGMRYCDHDWIFRMDTDDLCTPERFKKQINFINNNQTLSICGGNILEFDESNNKLTKTVPCSYEDIIETLKLRSPFNHMTVAFRKNAVLSVGGYPEILHMEDYYLWIKILAAGFKAKNMSATLVEARAGVSMLQRRRGFSYIRSEYILAKAKVAYKIDTPLYATLAFIIRSIARVLPVFLLSYFYKKYLR